MSDITCTTGKDGKSYFFRGGKRITPPIWYRDCSSVDEEYYKEAVRQIDSIFRKKEKDERKYEMYEAILGETLLNSFPASVKVASYLDQKLDSITYSPLQERIDRWKSRTDFTIHPLKTVALDKQTMEEIRELLRELRKDYRRFGDELGYETDYKIVRNEIRYYSKKEVQKKIDKINQWLKRGEKPPLSFFISFRSFGPLNRPIEGLVKRFYPQYLKYWEKRWDRRG